MPSSRSVVLIALLTDSVVELFSSSVANKLEILKLERLVAGMAAGCGIVGTETVG